MARSPKRLLLVTGLPRSGTTAVGDMLAYSDGARSLYEPFNRHVGMREVDVDFPVIGADGFSAEVVATCVDKIRTLDLDLRPGVFPHDEGVRRIVKRVSGSRGTLSYRLCRLDPRLRTIVWKDPFAFYAAEAAIRHDIPVIVTVRNPWAIGASFKRMGWGFDVADLQRRLREAGTPSALDLPTPTRAADPTLNGVVHWCLSHEWLLDRLGGSSGLHLVDLDVVIGDPVGTFRRLYDELALAWSPRVEAKIVRRYAATSASTTPRPGVTHDRRRDLSAVNQYWQGVLDERELTAINELAGPLWERVSKALSEIAR